jgi:hypothetical protein
MLLARMESDTEKQHCRANEMKWMASIKREDFYF